MVSRFWSVKVAMMRGLCRILAKDGIAQRVLVARQRNGAE